jgi:formylglycine-generating enzyme required for sulfatase activity
MRQTEWIESLVEGRNTLRGLLDATEGRLQDLGQSKPPAYFIYIDQGEELYVRSEERQRRRFSQIIAQGLSDPRVRMLMSIRSDFLGALQNDEPLFNARLQIDVPPLREAALREVVSRPAAVLSARFENQQLAGDIARCTAEESVRDAGALPLLSYLLDDMWTQMVQRGDGVLRLPSAAVEIGGVLVDRANKFLAANPKAEDVVRRVLTLRLATVREDGEPTRRRAPRSEFTDEEWRLVSDLADHPYRLLVTAAPEGGEPYAEVAHEAIFRRWDKMRDWVASEREFLAWRSGLEAACRSWQATPEAQKSDALLMGAALGQAKSWLAKGRGTDLPPVDREFIDRSIALEKKAMARIWRTRIAIYTLLVGVIFVLVGWMNQAFIVEQANWFMTQRPYMLSQVRPYVLTAERERALQPSATFRECAKDCPEMIVMPAGTFLMGSQQGEKDIYANELPQHKVTIAKPFAVSIYDVTFEDWDACASVGGCPQVGDSGFGRGRRPVINVSWNHAKQYVAWFSKMTGKTYRLLTEAEWEYTARAGTTTPFYWGREPGQGNANCTGCGGHQFLGTSPVGSFKPNAWGLYDMAGNVWQSLEDCYHSDYKDAPTDGSAWLTGDCSKRVVRGGSWGTDVRDLRSANRRQYSTEDRNLVLGFRVARTLAP